MCGLVLGVILLAACGTGAPAGPDANPDDLDGDGIPNRTDNCPNRANADQHDEDVDGVGDVCDNCPTVFNETQRDSTEAATNGQFADGVGDACDLRPGLSGDKIAQFFSLADPVQAGSFTGTGWTIDNDRTTSTGEAQWVSKAGHQGDGAIAVAVIEEPYGGPFTLAVDGDGVNSGAACTLNTAGELVAADLAGGQVMSTTAPVLVPPITLVAWRSITAQGSTQVATVQCRATGGGPSKSVEVPLADTTVVGNVAIVATGASTTISSLILYTSPGPKTP